MAEIGETGESDTPESLIFWWFLGRRFSNQVVFQHPARRHPLR